MDDLVVALQGPLSAIPAEALQPEVKDRIIGAVHKFKEWGETKSGPGTSRTASWKIAGGAGCGHGGEAGTLARVLVASSGDAGDAETLYQQLAAQGLLIAGDSDTKRRVVEAIDDAQRRKTSG